MSFYTWQVELNQVDETSSSTGQPSPATSSQTDTRRTSDYVVQQRYYRNTPTTVPPATSVHFGNTGYQEAASHTQFPQAPAFLPQPTYSNYIPPNTSLVTTPTPSEAPTPRTQCDNASCNQTFARAKDMTRHFKSVHEKNRVECPTCKVSFSRADALKRHQGEQHE